MDFVDHHIRAPRELDTSWLTLHLAQIACPIDAGGHIVDVVANRSRLEALLDLAEHASRGAHPSVTVLPELGLATALVGDLVARFASFPPGHLLVAGLDRTTAADARAIAAEYCEPEKHRDGFLASCPPNGLVNTTVVVSRGERNRTALRLLFKHTSSSYEAHGPLPGQQIYGPNYVPIYELGDLRLVVLTCSDMFTRAAGARLRLIDELNYQQWRRSDSTNTPVILINHQRTPKTGDEHFVESLRRIYDGADEEHGSARGLCTVMLNHAKDAVTGGGESLVVLHKAHAAPIEEGEYEWVRAPVQGYQAPAGELVMSVAMRRPDHLLRPQAEPEPMKISLYSWHEQRWRETSALRTRQVIEANALPVHHASLLDVAETMADHQQFRTAVEWAGRSLAAARLRRDPYGQAAARRVMALNARRGGELRRAEKLFVEAAEDVKRADPHGNPKVVILAWLIAFGHVALEKQLLQARPADALEALEDLVGQARRDRVDELAVDEIDIYEAQLERQRGELLMNLGRYCEALAAYERAYDGFGWESGQDKALACAGVAHAHVLLGDYADAAERVRDVGRFLRVHPDSRVGWRYLRLACELGELARRGVDALDLDGLPADPQRGLAELTAKGTFRVELVYATLTLGVCALNSDPPLSLKYFEEAQNLADGRPAHAELPKGPDAPSARLERLPLEHNHAVLGQAEAHRLAGEPQRAVGMYRELLRFYEGRDLLWGVDRAQAGLWLCGAHERPSPHDRPGRQILAQLPDHPMATAPGIFLCIP